jgi:hypothetical protein
VLPNGPRTDEAGRSCLYFHKNDNIVTNREHVIESFYKLAEAQLAERHQVLVPLALQPGPHPPLQGDLGERKGPVDAPAEEAGTLVGDFEEDDALVKGKPPRLRVTS